MKDVLSLRLEAHSVCLQSRTGSTYLLVYIIFDGQQVITHSLKSQFMKHRGAGVEAAVQDQELGARLVWALEGQTQGRLSQATHTTPVSPTGAAAPPVKAAPGSDLGDKTY